MGKVAAAAEVFGPTYLAAMESIQRGHKERSAALIIKARDGYYDGGESDMTDREWDLAVEAHRTKFGEDLRAKIKVPAAAAPQLAPGKKKARVADVAHRRPLLFNTLSKCQGIAELVGWLSKSGAQGVSNLLGSAKWDGLSVVIDYDSTGTVLAAQTRGDDGHGTDVTKLFAGEAHFSDRALLPKGGFALKYECCMTWSQLEALNAKTGKGYKNPRNTVAGIASKSDPSGRRPFILLAPLDIEYGEDGFSWGVSRVDRLQLIQDMFGIEDDDTGLVPSANFLGNPDGKTPWSWVEFEGEAGAKGALPSAVENLQALEARIIGQRATSGLMIDGAVIEFIDPEIVDMLGGMTPDEPAHVTALKFPHQQARTVARALEWDDGKTGRVTPCVVFDPVEMNGNTYKRVSIANMIRFDELKLCPGTPLIFELRNDVLGYVSRGGEDPPGAVPFPEPEGVVYTHDSSGARVFAMRNRTIEGRVQHALEKLGVKGVKESRIDKIVAAGLITELPQMMALSTKQLQEKAEFGPVEAQNIVQAITDAVFDGVDDFKLIACVGIPGIGRTVAREILKVVSLDEIAAIYAGPKTDASPDAKGLATPEEEAMIARISAAHGLGDKTARIFAEHMCDCIHDILEIGDCAPHVRRTPQGVVAVEPKTLVVTGDLEGWGRDDFKTLVESMGHKLVGSVSKNTSYLVTNTPTSGTVKNRKARDLGVPVVTETEIISILGLPSPGKAANATAPGAAPVETQEVALDNL